MKKFHTFFRFLLIIVILLPGSSVLADNGVDDLRGRWDIDVTFLDPDGNPVETLPPLILYVNEMRASLYIENTFYAGGCMRSPGSDVFMPLSIRAVYDGTDNAYDATIYSTYVPDQEGGEPYVIRLTGRIFIHGEGVSDDTVGGAVATEFATGEWSGIHHDRRKTKCPSVSGASFGVQGDVYAHQDLGHPTLQTVTLYEMHTVIVSSGLLVEAPDGSTTVVQEYTDIFSPDVDFIGRFRYLSVFDGAPNVGGTYSFVLLDVFGDPIPGTESTDTWTGCNQTAPMNLSTSYGAETDVLLEWDAVPDVTGEFEPGNDPQIGFYQIGISAYNWEGSSSFGSNLIKSPSHVIPWNHFEPGTPGTPDGDNYGIALSEFEDGAYTIDVSAFSEANPQYGGRGLECAAYDSTDRLVMTKDGADIGIEKLGGISGFVYDAEGNPLANIAVDTEEGGYGTCTNESGFYILQGIPFGNYNIVAGRDFCGPHPFAEQTQFDVPVGSSNVNFHLSPASQYEPVLHVVPAYPEIHGHGWNPDATVTIFVDEDDDLENGYLYTESKGVNDEPTWCIAPCFDVSEVPALPDGILPGFVVTMTDGEATRVVHTTTLVWNGTNSDEDTVFGIADPGAWIEVSVHEPEQGQRLVQVDGNGDWVADFSTPGPQDFEQDVLDLGPGYHGRAIEFEAGIPDDGTLAYWHIEEPPAPFLNVQPDHLWADSGNWASGTSVTLSFGSYSDTLIADSNGSVWFDLTGTNIAPGATVFVTDGMITKDVLVVSATFDSVDDTGNTATGTAPAGSWLGVGVIDENGQFYWADGFQAGTDGTWFVDFDDYDQDFGVVTDAWVHVFDEDGDSTLAHLFIP